MLLTCVSEGIRKARRNRSLVTMLWAWHLTLAAIAALPAWLWLGSAFNLAPESDRILSGFSLDIFRELSQYDHSPVRGILLVVILAIAVLAAMVNPLLNGGMIGALLQQEEGTPMERFWRCAGRFYWPFLRLLVWALATAATILALLGAAFGPLWNWAGNSSWEPAPFASFAVEAPVLIVAGVWVLLALDYARIGVIAEGKRHTVRLWFSSLLFVLRHPTVTFGLIASATLAFAAIAAVYTTITNTMNPGSWRTIATVILLQQLVMFARTFLRVGLVAGEIEYCWQLIPLPEVSAPGVEEPIERPAPIAPAPSSTNPDDGSSNPTS